MTLIVPFMTILIFDLNIPTLKVLGGQDAKIMKLLPLIILELSITSKNTAIKCYECFDSIRNTQKIVVTPPCDEILYISPE